MNVRSKERRKDKKKQDVFLGHGIAFTTSAKRKEPPGTPGKQVVTEPNREIYILFE